MSEAGEIETRDPEDLRPHPRSEDIYDDDADESFVASIEEQGVLEPIVITEESHCADTEEEVIISGHRRTDAAKKAGLDEVPVRVEEYDTEYEEREAVIEYNKQREKTFSQKMREADELMEIESEKARERMKQGGQGTQELGDLSKGETREKVAERFDRSVEWLRQAQKVWEPAKDGQKWAEEYVEDIEDEEVDESVNSAYKAARRREKLAEIDEDGAPSIMAEGDRDPEGDRLASFQTSMSRLKQLIRRSALDGEESYEKLHLEVIGEGSGEVRVLQSAPGGVVLSYCSFYMPYLDDITLNVDDSVVITFDVEEIQSRLDSIAGDVVQVELRGEEDESMAAGIRLVGELETWLPASRFHQEEEWPEPSRWTDQNAYLDQARDKEMPTRIDTEVREVEKIIWAAENTIDPDSPFGRSIQEYPIIVEGGEFRFRIEGEQTYLQGLLRATVEGPDVENYYAEGFTEVFGVLSGAVEIQTAPDDNPMAVVWERHGQVIRHVLGAIPTADDSDEEDDDEDGEETVEDEEPVDSDGGDGETVDISGFEGMSKQELYEIAVEEDISGRSNMSREELARALQGEE